MLGEPVQWSGTSNDIGVPGSHRVHARGVARECPNCREQFLYVDILIESDILVSVKPVGKEWLYEDPEGFVVTDT